MLPLEGCKSAKLRLWETCKTTDQFFSTKHCKGKKGRKKSTDYKRFKTYKPVNVRILLGSRFKQTIQKKKKRQGG